jgi:predicted SprT family Zn-dependent metalloprotease
MSDKELMDLCYRIKGELEPRFPEIRNVKFIINWRLRNALGRANCRQDIIQLSAYAYVNKTFNDSFAENTIRHELAHIIAYKKYNDRGHGPTWRAVAMSVGCNPRATATGIKTGDEVTISCHHCNWQGEHSKRALLRWDRNRRIPMCPRCKKGMRFPWDSPAPAPIMPKRILLQNSSLTP